MLKAFALTSRLLKSLTKSQLTHSKGKVVVSNTLLPTPSCVRIIVALPPVAIFGVVIFVTLPVSVNV